MGTIIPKKPAAILVTGDHTVTSERHLNVDATTGPVVITIPAATVNTNRTVGKVDDSANTVTINEDGGGTLATLTTQGQRAGMFTEGSSYTVRVSNA